MSALKPRCALGIFAKAPVPGQVKTRLATTIGPDAAAQWYTQSLHVVFQRTAAAWPKVERVLFYDPPGAESAFDVFAAVPVHQTPQQGQNLGVRMAAALQYCFNYGMERVVLIGTDAPTVPMERLGEAWDALQDADVVVGPATDGGYYLIATRAPQPQLFEGIAWSTDAVLSATLARAADRDLRVQLLPEWFDVDTAEDLAALPPNWNAVP